MSENLTVAQTSSTRSLRVLLLVCAGALLIIVVTLASAMGDARTSQSAHATQQANSTCGIQAQEFRALPLALQPQLTDQCAGLPEPAIR